jgi:hypothetical protein
LRQVFSSGKITIYPSSGSTAICAFNTIGLGIGISAPSYPLHVVGNSYINGNLGVGIAPHSTAKLYVSRGSSIFNGNIAINTTGTSSYPLYVNGTSYLNGNVGVGTTPHSTAKLYVSGVSYFNGNVGIGIASPTQKLHVVGNSYFNGNIAIGVNSSDSKFHIRYNGDATKGEWAPHPFSIWSGDSNTDYALLIGTDKNTYCAYLQSIRINTAQATISLNPLGGSVAIGTKDAKGYKLAVAGNVIAEKYVCKLQGNWPDFVFNEDYKLTNILEVEQYVKEHKHLPNVPSANQLKENGIDLEEMSASLLQKVEEQMLYIIEQQKAIEKLNEQVKNLEKELKR